jgi:plastocyanin
MSAPGEQRERVRISLNLQRITRPLFALLLLSALGLSSPGWAKGLSEQVDIEDGGDMASWDYSRTTLTITAGTAVLWRNTGSLAHSVTSQDQLFDSRLLDANMSWSYTFDTPGTYRYFCVPHPWMKGTIVVRPAEEPRSSGRGDSSETTRADEQSENTASEREGDDDASRDKGVRSPTATATATFVPTPTATPTTTPSPTPAAAFPFPFRLP